MRRSRGRPWRRRAAWLCLAALTASVIALPAAHVAVHVVEHLAAEAAAVAAPARPRVVVHRHGHCHGGSCHVDDGDQRQAPAPRESHHHDGDRDGGHGRHGPEHLATLFAPASAPAVPPRITPAVIAGRAVVLRPIAIAAVATYAARAPPAARA